jgi:hypothetical protein
MTLIEAAKQALEALEESHPEAYRHVITALRTAIEQAEKQEPVAWKHDCAALLQNDVELWVNRCPHCGKPSTTPPAQPAPVQEPVAQCMEHGECFGGECIYATPPAAQWVGLTDEEKEQATGWSVEHIEQALKEKNSGNQDGCSHAALPAADDLIATYEKGFKDGSAQRQWVDLTNEQKAYFAQQIVDLGTDFVAPLFAIVEAIEAKLKEKNT